MKSLADQLREHLIGIIGIDEPENVVKAISNNYFLMREVAIVLAESLETILVSAHDRGYSNFPCVEVAKNELAKAQELLKGGEWG